MLSQPRFNNRAILIDPQKTIDFGVRVPDLQSLAVLIERQARRRFRISYSDINAIDFSRMHDPNVAKLEALLHVCFDVGKLTLAIDEIDMFCNPYGTTESMKHLLARGRHYNIDLIWTTRRPQEVSKLLLSQTDEFYLFQMHHPADVKYFQEFMPIDRESLLGLNVGQSLHWRVGQSYSDALQKPE